MKKPTFDGIVMVNVLFPEDVTVYVFDAVEVPMTIVEVEYPLTTDDVTYPAGFDERG